MEIVIKISDKDYQLMKDGHIPFSILDKMMNGIPLPKGHGKIVDANRVLENGDNWEVETALMQTEAIIEADTESEE